MCCKVRFRNQSNILDLYTKVDEEANEVDETVSSYEQELAELKARHASESTVSASDYSEPDNNEDLF